MKFIIDVLLLDTVLNEMYHYALVGPFENVTAARHAEYSMVSEYEKTAHYRKAMRRLGATKSVWFHGEGVSIRAVADKNYFEIARFDRKGLTTMRSFDLPD